MLREFKAFVLRGNVIDLAIAVVIGSAFAALVGAVVSGLLTPFIAAIFGKHDFSSLEFVINGSHFRYGAVANALITFLSVAAVLFFFVVKPTNWLIARSRREPAAEPDTRKCDQCLSVVPAQARRCAFCTSELAPAA